MTGLLQVMNLEGCRRNRSCLN